MPEIIKAHFTGIFLFVRLCGKLNYTINIKKENFCTSRQLFFENSIDNSIIYSYN